MMYGKNLHDDVKIYKCFTGPLSGQLEQVVDWSVELLVIYDAVTLMYVLGLTTEQKFVQMSFNSDQFLRTPLCEDTDSLFY